LIVAAKPRVVDVLLVEDSRGNSKLTLEAIRDYSVETDLNVVHDGAQAMAFLRHEGAYNQAPRPALILLDLDLPRKAGHEVLAALKDDPVLRRIPVIAFSTAESDLATAYRLHANCYIRKPENVIQLKAVVRCIEEFWLTTVRLPAG